EVADIHKTASRSCRQTTPHRVTIGSRGSIRHTVGAIALRGAVSHNTRKRSYPSFHADVMTLKRAKIYLPVAVLLIFAAGCEPTRRPLTELGQASRSLDAARTAGAATYAPLELRFADERMLQSRTAADKHDYDKALRLAAESQANSDLAIAKSRLGKVRERVD